MSNITLTLIEKKQLVDEFWAFRFKPSESFTWVAGQFIYVELPHDNPDDEGTKRWFTISAAPYEGVVQITTRITPSTFKQALSALPIGGTLDLLEKPDGDFVWQQSDKPLVFVAGGIGVTPFYAMLKQRAHDQMPMNAHLIYVSRIDSPPFSDELAAWQAADSQLRVTYLVRQRPTPESLRQLEPQLNESLVYLSGPEYMVKSLGQDLIQNGLPQSLLRTDEFPNYDGI